MGYPTVYRSAVARSRWGRLSEDTVVLFEIPKRTPPPSRDTRAATMRRITESADMPPLSYQDLWPLLTFARRLSPWGRLFDLWDLLKLFDEWYRKAYQRPEQLPGNWHVCWMKGTRPDNEPFWSAQPGGKGPIGHYFSGGSYGVHVPEFLWGFFTSTSYTGMDQASLPWCFIIQKRTDGVELGEMVGAAHQDAENPAPLIEPRTVAPPAPTPQVILSRWRWIDPHRMTPLIGPALDPGAPPAIKPEEWSPPLEREARNDPPVPVPEIWPIAPPVEVPERIPLAPRLPPGKRTKEKKFKTSTMVDVVASALKSTAFVHGKMADLRDLLQAMHDSLPKHLQLKGKDKKQLIKLFRRVYENLDQMDAKEAFLNILKEIFEDIMGGIGDKLRSKAAAKNKWFKNKIFTSGRF